jgi:hypothetical protein
MSTKTVVVITVGIVLLLLKLSQNSFASQVKLLSVENALIHLKEAVDRLTEYSVIHIQQERFHQKLGPKIKMQVKFSKDRFYLSILEGPMKNAEVLYGLGWNSGKVKVHKGSFPDITVNLDPHGSRMLEDQHHPIEHLSFSHIVQSLYNSIQSCRNFPESSGKILSSKEGLSLSNQIQLELIAPWKERTEPILKDEDIWSFSKRVHADPFLILYSNQFDYSDSLSEGTSLKVPLCYATRTLLTLDSTTYLPRKMQTFDKAGNLYESYEWEDLNPAPGLKDIDFDPDNKTYRF